MPIKLVFLAQVAVTLAMVGITWFAQIVHYPLLSHVGEDTFSDYEACNMRLTTLVVGPLILAEGGTALILVWRRPEGVLLFQALLGVGLLAAIWLSTFFLQVPIHKTLVGGFDLKAHRGLVMSNWIRTIAWSARGILVLWMVGSVT